MVPFGIDLIIDQAGYGKDKDAQIDHLNRKNCKKYKSLLAGLKAGKISDQHCNPLRNIEI